VPKSSIDSAGPGRQRLQPVQGLVGVVHQDGLGQLQLQQVRRQSADGQHAGHAVDEVRLLELQRRDVDGHRHGVPALRATAPPGARPAQHPVADGDDEAAVLGHRDEAPRRHLAQLGIAPAQQRLGADDAPSARFDLRLVVQPEAAADQGLAHGVVQPHVRAAVDLGAGLVQAEVGAAGVLDLAHRGLGVAHQVVDAAAVLKATAPRRCCRSA
jgi:hypothetical protein